ncbi:hypothetical protein D3C83_269260 [compost metagenome]
MYAGSEFRVDASIVDGLRLHRYREFHFAMEISAIGCHAIPTPRVEEDVVDLGVESLSEKLESR